MGKEEVKLLPFVDDMILNLKKTKQNKTKLRNPLKNHYN